MGVERPAYRQTLVRGTYLRFAARGQLREGRLQIDRGKRGVCLWSSGGVGRLPTRPAYRRRFRLGGKREKITEVTQKGYHIVCWRGAGLDYCTASDTGMDELLDLVRLVKQQ